MMKSRSMGRCCMRLLLTWLMVSILQCGSRACRDPSDTPEQCASTRAEKQVFITCNANAANQFEKVLHQLRYQVEAPVVFGQELQLAPKQ
eukprot:7816398-Pyramimonas_sp.AAC.1